MEIDKIIKREIVSLIVSVVLILMIFIGVSFSSFFTVAESQETTISFGELNMVFCKDTSCNANYTNYGQTIGLESVAGVSNPINIYPYASNYDALSNITPYIFNIENTGTIKMNADVMLEDDLTFVPTSTYADFINASTTYSDHIKIGIAECDGETPAINNVIVKKYGSLTDNKVLENELINVGEDKTYCMWIWLDENTPNSIQKSYFVANISAEGKYLPEIPAWYELCDNNSTDLKCKIKQDNNVYSDAVSSTYVTSSTGINFSEVNSPSNGQGLYSDNKNGDGKNAYFRGGTYCAYNNYNIETNSGTYCTASSGVWDSTYHCSLDDSKSSCESAGFTYYELNNNLTFGGYAWKIIRIDEEGNIRLLYNGTTTTSRDSSAYISPSIYNAQAIGDNRSVGYMYGTIDRYSTIPVIGTSNYIKNNINISANYCYSKNLIINVTTGEMSLDSPTCALFSSTYADGTYYTLWSTNPSATSRIYSYRIESFESSTSCNFRYVSVTAENTGNEFDNDINSTIKSEVDDWYNTNMSSNTSKLADAGYCNDRSIYSGTGIGSSATQYKAYYARSTMPKYICENSVRDLFTLTDSTKGNKKLTYPVGLLSSDEITYGGTVYSNSGNGSYHSYLHIGNYYWTMSPFNFIVSRGRASCRDVHAYGGSYTEGANGNYGVRPVIALKPDTLYVSGNGSVDTPYVVN